MKSSLFLFGLAIVEGVLALGQKPIVTTTAQDGLLQIAGEGIDGQILLSDDDWWGAIRAAEDLAGDVGKVTGRNLTLGNWKEGNMRRDGSLAIGEHEVVIEDGERTTVLYTYSPPTSDVNVQHLSLYDDLGITNRCDSTHSLPNRILQDQHSIRHSYPKL